MTIKDQVKITKVVWKCKYGNFLEIESHESNSCSCIEIITLYKLLAAVY